MEGTRAPTGIHVASPSSGPLRRGGPLPSRLLHDLGILEPAHIDSHTGYRFYDTSQVDHAHIIRRFRNLGMSIPDIKALLSTQDAAARAEIITTHLEQMEVQLQQTRDAVGALRELLSPVRTPAPVEVQHKPAFAVWSIGATVDLSEIDDWFGVTLQALRDAVGDTTFFKLLPAWASAHRYGNANTADFVKFAEGFSGQNLSTLFHDWLYSAGQPPRP